MLRRGPNSTPLIAQHRRGETTPAATSKLPNKIRRSNRKRSVKRRSKTTMMNEEENPGNGRVGPEGLCAILQRERRNCIDMVIHAHVPHPLHVHATLNVHSLMDEQMCCPLLSLLSCMLRYTQWPLCFCVQRPEAEYAQRVLRRGPNSTPLIDLHRRGEATPAATAKFPKKIRRSNR